MKNFTPEMIEQARTAKTAEELAEMAKAADVELTAEEANAYFEQLHPKTGELDDDELEDVSGGGCKVTVKGKKYTVVTSGLKCFTGKYKCIGREGDWAREDKWLLRQAWNSNCYVKFVEEGTCGDCAHLEFKGSTGYCGVS